MCIVPVVQEAVFAETAQTCTGLFGGRRCKIELSCIYV
jgi:hypothetical protein